MIEVSLIQTLIAVERAGTFSLAAQELNVTQSAVSQNIKNLETKVGVKLLQRSGRRYILTQEGQKLASFGKEFLRAFEETLNDVRQDQGQMRGRIRIGTLTGVGKSWLSSVLIDFGVKYPEIDIELTMGFQTDLVQRFEEHDLDCVVIPESDMPLEGDRKLLPQEMATLIVPKNYQLEEDLTYSQLMEQPLVLYEENDLLFRRWCKKKFRKVPRKLSGHFVMNGHGSILHAVSKGLGVAVVPTHVLQRSFYSHQVKILKGDCILPCEKFYIVTHKEQRSFARIQKLKDVIVNEAKSFGSVENL
jgi:DNA-binding transcriptional LysR family regulator